jgi:hypothetical protein
MPILTNNSSVDNPFQILYFTTNSETDDENKLSESDELPKVVEKQPHLTPQERTVENTDIPLSQVKAELENTFDNSKSNEKMIDTDRQIDINPSLKAKSQYSFANNSGQFPMPETDRVGLGLDSTYDNNLESNFNGFRL